ncbi:MAG TPA: YihY/virulence factor BrkB family protein [Casimicrobiaceae bacterium]|nr:YihY/virulence factor BrkB family protein [Casimicrobiaceae bacterium]
MGRAPDYALSARQKMTTGIPPPSAAIARDAPASDVSAAPAFLRHAPALRTAWLLVRETVSGWIDHRASSLGAALAYYTAFSLAPLLLIAIAVAGIWVDSDIAAQAIAEQASALLGPRAAEGVEFMLRAAPHAASGWLAGAVGLVTLIIGATTVLTEVQYDLDMIWRAPPRKSSGMIVALGSRLLSFGLVICIGFLFLASLVVSTGLSALSAHGIAVFPGSPVVLTTAHVLAWGVMLTTCFALLYKWLPNIRLAWGEVLAGALVTTVLFSIGRLLIGLYLTHTATASMHGAAGALIILLLWFYYSAQVFLLGAEFTVVYARRLGSLRGAAPGAALAL